jgi:hypothetical protein
VKKIMRRALIHGLALVLLTLALSHSGLTIAQATGKALANLAPNPRAVEERRRLMLSHRRRGEQVEENAQYNSLLTTNTAPLGRPKRPRHRPAGMHRNTTALGRKAANSAPAPAVAQ